jgi:hypothetical protein
LWRLVEGSSPGRGAIIRRKEIINLAYHPVRQLRTSSPYQNFQWVTVFTAVSLVSFGFWSLSANADAPSEKRIVDVREMSVKVRAELGEKLIFGSVGASKTQGAIGKAQCPLCHGFQKDFLSERAPNLYGITERAKERLKDPRYHLGKPNERDTVQREAFPGSGTAITAIEYIAESAICSNCYVVAGFGVKGTNDRESAEVFSMHKPPVDLSIDELIAIDTWLYVHDGKEPPSPQEIEQAYRKFIPEAEWPKPSSDREVYPAKYRPGLTGLIGKESMDRIFTAAMCFACHTIPGIPGAVGIVGPKLDMKTTAPKRLKDPKYKGKATNVREYIFESIVMPSIYVVEGFQDNIMPKDYLTKLNGLVLGKMVDYLSQLEEGRDPPRVP